LLIIEDNGYLLQVVNYIHLNPVRAEIVEFEGEKYILYSILDNTKQKHLQNENAKNEISTHYCILTNRGISQVFVKSWWTKCPFKYAKV